MENTLHSFGAGTDGCEPFAGLVVQSGQLYGSTIWGGSHGSGIIFSLTTDGDNYLADSFLWPSLIGQIGPEADLITDAAGNVYGTTVEGGAFGLGSVFEGVQTILHSFTGGSDGKYPTGSVIFDAGGNLYGTAGEGGANGYGTIWEITP